MTNTRNPGEFCWINMLTPRPDEARAFFGEVLGWTYFEMPGIGHGIKVGGHNIGGLFDLEGPNTPAGTPPLIGVMIKVESADRAGEQVAVLGGKAKSPFDIMEQGRMAVCYDPAGANFDVWQPKRMPGTDVDTRLHGAPSWFEAMTTDIDRGREFYSGLFGWVPEVMLIQGREYVVFRLDAHPVAGMMKITPSLPNVQPRWATYFTVDDPHVAANDSVRLGARLHAPVEDIPSVGRFCCLTSPQGVTFSVVSYPT